MNESLNLPDHKKTAFLRWMEQKHLRDQNNTMFLVPLYRRYIPSSKPHRCMLSMPFIFITQVRESFNLEISTIGTIAPKVQFFARSGLFLTFPVHLPHCAILQHLSRVTNSLVSSLSFLAPIDQSINSVSIGKKL